MFSECLPKILCVFMVYFNKLIRFGLSTLDFLQHHRLGTGLIFTLRRIFERQSLVLAIPKILKILILSLFKFAFSIKGQKIAGF